MMKQVLNTPKLLVIFILPLFLFMCILFSGHGDGQISSMLRTLMCAIYLRNALNRGQSLLSIKSETVWHLLIARRFFEIRY